MKTACSTKLQQPVIAESGSLSILTVDVYRGFTDFRYFGSRLLDGKKLIYTSVESACVHRAIKLVIFLEAVLNICFKISFSTEIWQYIPWNQTTQNLVMKLYATYAN